MEVVPFDFCHQTAFCRIILWFFRRKLLQAIFRCSKPLHRSREFLERGSNRHAVTQQRLARGSKGQQSQSSRRRPDAAGGKAFRRFLAHLCCCLFFSLGFKFCCIVLRVANARDLIIDLRRVCYLQRITTQTDSDNGTVIRVRPYNLLYTFVTALKATAWCRVLIAQFGINFDAALHVLNMTTMSCYVLEHD